MKKIEMEQLLMRPERVAILNERAEYLKNKYGENGTTGGKEADRVILNRQLPHEIVQNEKEIKANDHDVVTKSELLQDLTQFVPEFKEPDPRALLRTLSKKYRENPTASEQLFIENLINKITVTGKLDKEDENIINEAIDVLTQAGNPKEKKPAAKRKEG